MKYYVGLDVSQKTTYVCIVDESGKIVNEAVAETDPIIILNYLSKNNFMDVLIGFESGSFSHYLTRVFVQQGLNPVCMDARKLKPFLDIKINKTDKNDARGIAEALRLNLYSIVPYKPQEEIDKSVLLAARRTLINQQTALKNTVRGLIKNNGLKMGAVSPKKFSEAVKKIIKDSSELFVSGIINILNVFDAVVEEISKIDKQVIEIANKDINVKKLKTIPGVGDITALSFVTEIYDPERFKTSKAVGAYFGMTPTQYQSGETKKQGRISRCGSRDMRFLLTEAAIVLLTRSKKWSKLKAWGLKIMKKKGVKKATMAVGRKLAVIMHRMMITQSDFIYGEPKENKNEKLNVKTKKVA
jgi:transposase